ncbi:MAG: hypothetical protein ACMZ66_10065 [Thalassospira sp.]
MEIAAFYAFCVMLLRYWHFYGNLPDPFAGEKTPAWPDASGQRENIDQLE